MGYGSQDYYRPTGFGGFSLFPPVIKKILIINGVVFFIQLLFEKLTFGNFPGWYILNRYFALNPIAGIDPAGQPFNFQIWQLFTYQFMHGGFMHIFFNMFILWMFGMELENLMGSKKFLFYYLLCGVGAGLAQIIFSPIFSHSSAFTIGASGAVFGVMIAFAMTFPDRYIFLYFLIPVKAKYLIAVFVVFEFMSVGDMSFVARLAHVGGAVTGVIFILLDRRHHFNIDKLFGKIKKPDFFSETKNNFRRPMGNAGFRKNKVEDAKFYEIHDETKSGDDINQPKIDEILDKISQSGYQNLTEKEKKILFEASKKK